MEKRFLAPQAGIWKVFDVLAIRGENTGRLIPKSLEDKLARFFRSRRNISGERNHVRVRTNKAFIQAEVRCIEIFSLNPPHGEYLFTFQQRLNLLEN